MFYLLKIFYLNSLWQSKGPELLLKAGGLHKFMNWDGALLTVISFFIFLVQIVRNISKKLVIKTIRLQFLKDFYTVIYLMQCKENYLK